MAGKFAKYINAKHLILNHFSSRYSGMQDAEHIPVMNEIRELAMIECKIPVICSYDLFCFEIARK